TRADEFRAKHGGTDSFQRPSDSIGMTRELDGRRIGQKLALPRHGRLDETAEKEADGAEHHEHEADEEQICHAAVLSPPPTTPTRRLSSVAVVSPRGPRTGLHSTHQSGVGLAACRRSGCG